MPDGGDEDGAPSTRCHIGPLLDGQQCDLGIELDELFHDDHGSVSSHAGQRMLPTFLEVSFGFGHRLAFPAGTHHRLDHTGETYVRCDRFDQFGLRRGVGIPSGGQSKLFGGQRSDGVAVHGLMCGVRAGNDIDPACFKLQQCFGPNGFNLGHHVIGPVLSDRSFECFAIQHVQNHGFVGHLHCGRFSVVVDGNHSAAKTLRTDGEFFPQLARAEKHEFWWVRWLVHEWSSGGDNFFSN